MSTASMPQPLGERLSRVHNLRDLGGTPCGHDGLIRPGRLLRSASLASATPEDISALLDSGVRDVVDLRADWELSGAGAVPPAFRTSRLILVPDEQRAATHEALRTRGLRGYYGWIFANARAQLAELVEIVAGAEGAVLVQCGAGKDRTGVAVACLLDLVGVADEHIAADYHRTTEALRRIRGDLVRTPGYERALKELPREVLGAPAAAILDALEALRAAHGSVRSYLIEGGLAAETVAGLRARLVAPRA